MEVKHCVMDLKDYVEGLRARLRRNCEAFKELGEDASKVDEARFETGQWMVLDFIDELERVTAAWEEGFPARRVTEKAIKEERHATEIESKEKR